MGLGGKATQTMIFFVFLALVCLKMLISFIRPESHHQVFCTIFFASFVWKVTQVYGSLLRAPVGNFIARLCKNENQCLESHAEFLQGNRTMLYFASKFSKSRCSQWKKLSFWACLGKYLAAESKQKNKKHRSQCKKQMRHNYQAKML